LAFRVPVVVSVAAADASVEEEGDDEAAAPEPELMDPDAPVVPDVPAVLPAVPEVLPAVLGVVVLLEPEAAAPEPPGVPVLPIGVFCVLRWPEDAGSEDVVGGVVCAKARLTEAAAMAAARILRVDMEELLC
jgi:hypothetical protein